MSELKLITAADFVSEMVDPLQDGKSQMQLVNRMGNDYTVLNAARQSYGNEELMRELEKDPELLTNDVKLIKFLLKYKHSSPFYHAQVSFQVKLPIFVARQWMRHNIGIAYNELSMRYVELGKKIPLEFFFPASLRFQHATNRQASAGDFPKWKNAILLWLLKRFSGLAGLFYHFLISQGVARELARTVLPVNVYTEIRMTASLWACIHFIALRFKPDAQKEIQPYAKAMQEMLEPFFPAVLSQIKLLKEESNSG